MERRLTWVKEGPNYWATVERVNGEPAFTVSMTMHGWLLAPAGDNRRFDAFVSPEAARTFAEDFEDRPLHLR